MSINSHGLFATGFLSESIKSTTPAENPKPAVDFKSVATASEIPVKIE